MLLGTYAHKRSIRFGGWTASFFASEYEFYRCMGCKFSYRISAARLNVTNRSQSALVSARQQKMCQLKANLLQSTTWSTDWIANSSRRTISEQPLIAPLSIHELHSNDWRIDCQTSVQQLRVD